jgi:putative ABC transport system permease protein
VNLVARTVSDPMSIVGAARGVVESIDRELAVTGVQSLEGVIADLMAPVRVIGGLMPAFGAIALALSAVGVHGVLAYGVARRTRELGMRMALGARPGDLMRLVIGHALKLSCVGLAVALPLAIALTRAMASLLFGLALLSPATVAGFAALFVLVSIAAGSVPAWRAMRVDPVMALRNE